MLPVVALVGRPNVGKSTLFNRLTATRDALVADYPGLTRDRRYGVARAANRKFIVIDTGGLTSDDSATITALVAEQVELAIEEGLSENPSPMVLTLSNSAGPIERYDLRDALRQELGGATTSLLM